MIQKPAAMGNWWLAASSQQHARSCITPHEEFFGQTSNHPGDSVPLEARFGALQLLAFPKTKTTSGREEISDCWWDSGKYDRAAVGESIKGFCRMFWTVEETLGELCKVPRCLLWRGLRHHCPCTMFLVSCTFFNKCLYFLYYMPGYFLARPLYIYQCLINPKPLFLQENSPLRNPEALDEPGPGLSMFLVKGEERLELPPQATTCCVLSASCPQVRA